MACQILDELNHKQNGGWAGRLMRRERNDSCLLIHFLTSAVIRTRDLLPLRSWNGDLGLELNKRT